MCSLFALHFMRFVTVAYTPPSTHKSTRRSTEGKHFVFVGCHLKKFEQMWALQCERARTHTTLKVRLAWKMSKNVLHCEYKLGTFINEWVGKGDAVTRLPFMGAKWELGSRLNARNFSEANGFYWFAVSAGNSNSIHIHTECISSYCSCRWKLYHFINSHLCWDSCIINLWEQNHTQ